MLCPLTPAVSQGLIFSNDTAILVSCEKMPPPIDSHWIYNTTDHDIGLRWQRVQYQVPEGTFYLMIFNDTQYAEFTSHGWEDVYSHDSTNIIFQFWHTDIQPGDSVIIRVIVYDEADSLNTAHYQTMIQYCPLETSNTAPFREQPLIVYPNPIQDEATVTLPASQEPSLLMLYNATGQIVRQISATHNEVLFSRDGLPNGLYFLSLFQEGGVTNMTKLVITD